MGHYDDAYEAHYEEEERRRKKTLQELRERWPEDYQLALEYKRQKQAYERFKHCI